MTAGPPTPAQQHLHAIVRVARSYMGSYPEWSVQQAVDIAASEYDCMASFTPELRQQAERLAQE